MLIKAHAGCEGNPANRTDALLAAASSGADIMEIDIQQTKDGALIAQHDEKIGGKSVADTSLTELKRCDPGLLTLEEALQLIRGFQGKINIDLKSEDIFEPLQKLLEQNGVPSQRCVLTGSGCDPRLGWRPYFPDSCVWIALPDPNPSDTEAQALSYAQEMLKQFLSLSIRNVNMCYRWLRPPLVEFAHQNGMRLHVWTVDNEADMRRMISYGVDSITTNYVRALKRILPADALSETK